MGLPEQQVTLLARNSFDACFASQEQRARWIGELDAAAAGGPGTG
jgi:adenosine deaminase